jgi:hypothetical protein
MEYSELIPHLFSSCILIETQIKKLEEISSKFSRADLIEFQGVIDSHKKLKSTANLLQMTVAKKDIKETIKLISIFYGLLFISRPSVTRLVDEHLSQKPCEILVKASNLTEQVMH